MTKVAAVTSAATPDATTAGPLAQTVVGEDGPTVAFCHGLLGRGRNFTGIAKALQPDFRCLLLDMPDHGGSPWTDGFDYERAAAAVVEHLRADQQQAGWRRCHLVGHSMGGKIAMTAALQAPDLLDRLVVVDISPIGSTPTAAASRTSWTRSTASTCPPSPRTGRHTSGSPRTCRRRRCAVSCCRTCAGCGRRAAATRPR